MRDIKDIRADINEIDRQMRALFVERMRLAEEVAEYKRAHGLAVHDPARERDVIEKNKKELDGEVLRPYYESFLQSNMDISRSYQDMLISQASAPSSTAACEAYTPTDLPTAQGETEDIAEIKKTIRIGLGGLGYDITVGRGLLCRADKYMNIDRKVAIITDTGVPAQYAKTIAALCKEARIITVEQGEKNKSMDTYAEICRELLDFGMQRSDAVVAVGGGVCGDMAGFAASTYMRGVDLYNVPTTLLSQVDSSVGGKTAIDFGGVKNVLGAFYQPKAVLIDTDVLKTLDCRQISAGLAEVVKMALTSDAELFEMLEDGLWRKDISEVIARALLIKKSVVEQDECEVGMRRVLNFGHTLGHGIESLGGLYHGECVALGMIPMCSPTVRERLIPLLEKIGLPVKFSGDLMRAVDFMKHDKKGVGDSTHVIFVDKPGSFRMEKMKFTELVEHIKSRI